MWTIEQLEETIGSFAYKYREPLAIADMRWIGSTEPPKIDPAATKQAVVLRVQLGDAMQTYRYFLHILDDTERFGARYQMFDPVYRDLLRQAPDAGSFRPFTLQWVILEEVEGLIPREQLPGLEILFLHVQCLNDHPWTGKKIAMPALDLDFGPVKQGRPDIDSPRPEPRWNRKVFLDLTKLQKAWVMTQISVEDEYCPPDDLVRGIRVRTPE